MSDTLTAKQEAFCLAIVTGSSQIDAYRQAYAAENMKAQTIYQRASELMADGKIADRVAELRAPAMKKAQRKLCTMVGTG